MTSKRRPKLTVATTFPIHPARGGGQARVLGLYGAVAELGVDVDVVTLGAPGARGSTTMLRRGLREIRVPQSADHHAAEVSLRAELGGAPVPDVGLAIHHELTPGYASALRASSANATAVVACHPYATKLLLDAAPGRPLVYEAHDVETDLKAELLGAHEVVDVVRDHEALACREAVHIVTCADEDARRLRLLFGAPLDRFAVAPNGYDPALVRHTPWDERVSLRDRIGLRRFTVVFVGSEHPPNVEAARALIAAAESVPDAGVLVVGSVGARVADLLLPANVDVTGPVHEGFLRAVLSLAHIAVNPVASGSGTNVKMLDYAAAGTPVVSSAFGARGLGFAPGEHYAEAAPARLAAVLETVAAEPEAETRRRAARAYERVRTAFEWRTIARDWLGRDDVRELLELA
jgi:glycosyltransferase involved in cell wall biosynthesis